MPPSFRALLRLLPLPAFSLCLLTLLSLVASPCAAATYYVSPTGSDSNPGTLAAPFLTIQHGINTAVSGDTVTVEDGTYTGFGNVDLYFGGRNITLISQHGADSTIIDCGGSISANHRGFYLNGGETAVVIEGLTIENGFEGDNSDNTRYGGGIYNYGSGLTVRRCILKNNTAYYGVGGGIYNYDFTNVAISVISCRLTGNTAQNGGGGIDNNTAIGPITITNCVLTGNTTQNNGGGIFNNTYYDSHSTITVTNCTLTGNSSPSGDGGGIFNGNSGEPSILTNDIVYGNTGGDILNSPYSTLPAKITCCDIQGGVPAGATDGGGNINANPLFFNFPMDLHPKTGSPCLGAGTSLGAPATTLDGQTRPTPPSIGAYEMGRNPIITTTTTLTSSLNPSLIGQPVTFTATVAGSGGTPTGTVTFTVDGTAQSPITLSNGYYASYTSSSLAVGSHTITAAYSGDISFASSASLLLRQTVKTHTSPQYVSLTGNDNNSGTQTAPKLTIQAAINDTLSGDTVIVEDGTYSGPGDVDLDFGGNNITVTSQNGPTSTIIDCGGSSSANHRGFLLHLGETNAVIRGLTIQGGYESNDILGSSDGGGIYSFGVILTVQNCILKNNTAVSGGGIYCSAINQGTNSGTSSVNATNCLFLGNSASYGSGLFTSPYMSTSRIISCTFGDNSATNDTVDNDSSAGSALILANDILYGDTGGEIGGSGISANYCDVQGGYAGTGNIDADPLFVNSPTDLHLQFGSPCIGAGTASGAPATDITGMTRPNLPSIGAYEPTPLPPPASLIATAGAGQVSLKWTAPAGVSGATYSLFRSTAAGAETVYQAGLTAASFTDIQVTPGIKYFYIVKAVVGSQTSVASNEASATPTAPVLGKVRYFPAVGQEGRMVGGKFQGSNDSSTWTTLYTVTAKPADAWISGTVTVADPKTFRFLRYLSPNGGYGNVAEIEFYTGTGTNAVKLTGMPFGTPGSYLNHGAVYTKALDGSTTTFFNAPSPGNGDFVGIDQVLPPTAPTGLTATGGSKITLTWTASAGAASYTLSRGTTAGSEAVYQSGLIGTSYTDTSVTAGVTYYYTLQAVNPSGTSATSNEASAATGTLAGSSAAIKTARTVTLTTLGTLDWAHWGLTTAASFDHKGGVSPAISNFTVVGAGTATRFTDNLVGFTWSNGTPTVSATGTTTGVYLGGGGSGFRVTVPADTTRRTLTLYVGGYHSDGTLTAHLSDGSALDFVDSSYGYDRAGSKDGLHYYAVYTLPYGAASAGQTLSVSWVQTTSSGNVTLQAATLAVTSP